MKETPQFDFLPEIPMDMEHQLDQSTSPFRTVREGLPELVKNAKDQYARLQVVDRGERQIVVVADTVKKSIAVIDFAGAQVKDFAGWMMWSSRTANRRGLAQDIEGGHGNGGKAFMVRGSTTYSFMESCSDGKRTRMGFDNQDGDRKYYPGYGAENGVLLEGVNEENPRTQFRRLLKRVALTEDMLPDPALRAFLTRKAFTYVLLDGIRDWADKRKNTIVRMAADIPSLLANHPQAALTLETSTVWVIVDGRCLTLEPLVVNHPAPFPGFENLPSLPVPSELPDPLDGEMVSTGPGAAEEKYLQLRTSEKQLRITGEGKAINVIRVRSERTVVANWSLAELVPRAESAFILGDIQIPGLEGDYLQDSHRTELADTPLARALRAWIEARVTDLAKQIQKAQMRETGVQEQNSANNALAEFRKLMRKYLDSDDIAGPVDEESVSGPGGDGPEGPNPPPPPPKPKGQVVDQIVLEPGRDEVALAFGTEIPLVVRSYETQEDGEKLPVPGVSYAFHAEPADVVSVGDGVLQGKKEGLAEIWATDPNSGISSNRVLVEVVRCVGIDVVGPDELLKQGQRVKLLVSFQTEDGRRDDLLIEGWVDETDLGRLSRNAAFTAGMLQGTATVRVRYGPQTGEVGVASIEIGTEVQQRQRGGSKGGDVPHILLCGVPAPGMDEYPVNDRTHWGGDRHPTIIEEPQFPHVVWINHSSKEALRVRQSRGGSSGVGRINSKTFKHFLALKCFDVLKRLRVRQALENREVTERQFTSELAQAEMTCAGFVDASYALADKIQELEVQE